MFHVISSRVAPEYLLELETEMIRTFRNLEGVYNHAPVGGTTRGMQMPVDVVERISAARRGRPLSSEHREAIRQGLLGKAKSPEAVEKSRRARTGATRSLEARQNMSSAAAGRPLSEKQIAANMARRGRALSDKQRVAYDRLRGVTPPAERIKRAAESNRGKTRTPEQKERMRKAALLREQRRRQSRGA